ncbi:MAG: hypothetical protein ACI8T1_001946 [Verrucomicrobiales bacterium]|jgi:hypothetical protein
MTYRFCIVFALLTAFLGIAQAHEVEGSNLQLIAELEEDKLTFDVSAETSLIPPLSNVQFGAEKFPTQEEVKDAITQYFFEHCPVLIDGIAVTPVLDEIQFDSLENQVNLGAVSNFVMTYFILNYPIKSKPQTVDMTWDIFLPDKVKEIVPQTPDPTGHEPQTVSSIFYTYGELDLMTFTPDEPQYIWHSSHPILSVDAQERLQAATEAAAQAVERTFSLAWPIVGILLVVALLTGIKRRIPLSLAFVVGSIAVAAAYRPLTISLGQPKESLRIEAAQQRFKDLHQNIYRAFDYDTDDAIYNTLTQSVSGTLLDSIYSDVYKSLVMKDEGGAVCRVKRLEYLECQPAAPKPNELGYAFDTHWRVYGLVQHWGHTHERVNEYQARYHLVQIDTVWKIDSVEISKEKRLNPKTLEAVN